MIEIAKECRTRYNCIFFGYADTFSHLIVQEGFEFRRMEPWLSERDIARLWKIDRMERPGNPFSVKQLRERVSGELLLYEELNPVAVVMGFTLSATISCRAAGIPLVCVMPFSYTAPFFKAKLAVFPESLDLPLLRRIPDRIQRRFMSYWGLHTRLWAGPFRRVAREYGILGLDRTMDLFQGDHNLVATVPELTGVRELPPGWRYVGPIYAKLPGELPEEIKSLPRDLPLIYFAMGSSARQDLLVKILNCFEGMPYRIVSPMKFHLEKLGLKLPENVQLYDWLPAHKVNPLADLAIIHGGGGNRPDGVSFGETFHRYRAPT